MKTAAVGNTVCSQEVTRLIPGRTFLASKVVLSSVQEHKLPQAAFLYKNVLFSHGLQRNVGAVTLSQLGVSSLLESQFLLPRAAEWGHELTPAQPSVFI